MGAQNISSVLVGQPPPAPCSQDCCFAASEPFNLTLYKDLGLPRANTLHLALLNHNPFLWAQVLNLFKSPWMSFNDAQSTDAQTSH